MMSFSGRNEIRFGVFLRAQNSSQKDSKNISLSNAVSATPSKEEDILFTGTKETSMGSIRIVQ